jgi:lysophospholipase L1-like esterase
MRSIILLACLALLIMPPFQAQTTAPKTKSTATPATSASTSRPASTMPAGKAGAGKPVVISNPAQDPTRPVPGEVRWFMRNHNSYVARTKAKNIDLCFLGDSVTAMWPGDLFNKYYGQANAVNFGVGGDRTQHVLWRLENGELEGTSPKVIVLLIGTNNSVFNPPEEIAIGVEAVVKTLRTKFPQTKILLLGIFPRKDALRAKTDAANLIIAKLDNGKMIRYRDLGPLFLDKDGKLLDGVLSDDVHLTRKGYEIWAKGMNPLLAQMMKK